MTREPGSAGARKAVVKAVAGTVVARAEVARVAEEAAAVNVAEGGWK